MRILLVEDQQNHMQEAIAILKAAGVEFVTATHQSAASRILSEHKASKIKLDGVITDIFMPHADQSPWHEADQPCGLRVALEAEALGLPFVMCTAGYHHGAKYDWICGLGRNRTPRWPEIVDGCSDYHDEAQHKDWAGALKTIQEIISSKV